MLILGRYTLLCTNNFYSIAKILYIYRKKRTKLNGKQKSTIQNRKEMTMAVNK